ncbi:hypothetical protein N7494_009666 [Penicillium frequentans]|uniref:Uncharacterized protein n=1 Tax=Penicillium frequentans TaxID=3151616 RepID=A0AAD6CS38_9EURO|nr:hypothetical protein N7494_009666 [Penicillium glabrum]
MSSSDNIGYSIRNNGTCASTEVDCGQTWHPYHACCPAGTFCPSGQSNVICCDSNANCLDYFKDDPHCANSTANLYKANGYFCCAEGLSAFELKTGFVGCTDDISALGAGASLLAISSSGSTTPTATPTSSASSRATTPVLTTASTTKAAASTSPTSTALSNKGSSSTTNTGAIAGAVVGSVAAVVIIVGLLWFFLRHRSKARQSTEPSVATVYEEAPPYTATQHNAPTKIRGPLMMELDSSKHTGVVELPGHGQYR